MPCFWLDIWVLLGIHQNRSNLPHRRELVRMLAISSAGSANAPVRMQCTVVTPSFAATQEVLMPSSVFFNTMLPACLGFDQ